MTQLRGNIQNFLIIALIGIAAALAAEPKTQDESPLAEADQAYIDGDFRTALKSYQWLKGDSKLGPLAQIKAGQCLLKMGNPSAALREWKSVRKSSPNLPEAATALALEIENTTESKGRGKLEDLLLKKYANSSEAKALLAARAQEDSLEKVEVTTESEVERLLEAGNREEAIKFMITAARRATGDEQDQLLAQLAALYESSGDWRKAAGAWEKVLENGNPKYKEAVTFDWIRYAVLEKYDDALRTYKRFDDDLSQTKSAAPALLRAGTLCAGPLNDSRRAHTFFAKVATKYPESPEAETCDWYSATLYLWAGDRRSAGHAFEEFEKKYPASKLIPTLDKTIRPKL